MGRLQRRPHEVSWYLTATPKAWAAHVERMKEAGDPVQGVPYEKIREFVLSEDYTATFDQNTRLGLILRPLPQLAAALDERHWIVLASEEGAPVFICSDRPLTVCWNDQPKGAWPLPGLGLRGTTVMFPLDRRHALVGMYETPFPATKAGPFLVGVVNMWTAFYSTKYIYSADADFHVTLPDRRPGNRDDLLRHFATARNRSNPA